jgi:hypothetical protein
VETEELIELKEEARGARGIGVTMAITAAILAVVTMMGHRLHTEEVVMQTKSADGWSYFQAKNNRYHMYANDAKLAELSGNAAAAAVVAADWMKKSEEEHKEASDVQKENEHLDRETEATARRATFFDISEICLEVGIVLCSIALLTRTGVFWRSSFVPIVLGMAIALYGLVPK